MAITYGFRESYSESYSEETNEVRAELQTNWADVAAFPKFVLGDVSGGGTLLNRQLPLMHPTKTLWASELSLKRGVGAFRPNDKGLIEFFDNAFDDSESSASRDGKAQWDVVYRPRPYDVLGNDKITSELQRWVIKESDYSLEAMSLPGDSFKFESNGGPIPEGIALQRQVEVHQYTWVQVPDTVVQVLRRGVWLSVPGRVNSVEFDGMPVGSALCMAPKKTALKYTVTGTACRDIVYTFAQRYGNTWNQAYNLSRKVGGVVKPGFDNVIPKAPNVDKPFLAADFATLFVPV